MRASDRALEGTWWRCEVHGLSDAPIYLGPNAYCANECCDRQLLLVHSATTDIHRAELSAWNKSDAPAKPRRAPPEVEHLGTAPARPARPRPAERAKGPPLTTLLLVVLRAAPGRTQTLAELVSWVRAHRPDASSASPYQEISALAKRGLVVRRHDKSVQLTDEGAARAQLEAAHAPETPSGTNRGNSGTRKGQPELEGSPAQALVVDRDSRNPPALSTTSGKCQPDPEREGSPPPAARRRRVSRPRPAAPDAAPSPPATAGVPSTPGSAATPAPVLEDAPAQPGVVLTRVAGRGVAAPAGTSCEVCGRRLRHGEPHVVIVAPDLELPVCAECAASGDEKMRAAAAPLLRDLVQRLRRRRAS